MNYLSVENLHKSYNETPVLEGVAFGIGKGEKVALVGINGSGKSTLLKILYGKIAPEEGVVSFRKDIRIAFLEQNPEFKGSDSIIDFVLSGDDPSLMAIRKYEKALNSDHSEKQQNDLSDAMADLDRLQAWDVESTIQQILGKLDINQLDRSLSSLSGGQKKRVALAKILIEKPDFLIMDEPTNHLDLNVIEWLEEYIAQQNMSLLLVTHDRYFLDKVCNRIMEIDEGKLYTYQGNYSYFLEKKEERAERDASELSKNKNLYRKELDWIRRQPKARGTKAKYRVEAFDDLKGKVSGQKKEAKLEIEMSARRQGKKILEIENLSKSYDQLKLIEDFSYTFKHGDRIGVIGKNGSGKSTLLNIITGRIEADQGEIEKGQNTVFGYYTQQDLVHKEEDRVIDHIKAIAEFIQINDKTTLSAGQLLQKFAFSPQKQYDYVHKLSGGEKRRLQLLEVLIKNPNFLILDEPTNDLDIMTLNILEEYLEGFPGCILLVSHDRYFMDRITNHLFVFEGEGSIRDFTGNFTDYREEKQDTKALGKQKGQEKSAQNQPSGQSKQESKNQEKLSYKEKLELKDIEKELEALESKKAELTQLMNSGSANHEEVASWSEEFKSISDRLEEKELRWLELSEKKP